MFQYPFHLVCTAVLKCHENRIIKKKNLKEEVDNLLLQNFNMAVKTYEKIQILEIQKFEALGCLINFSTCLYDSVEMSQKQA